MANPFRRLCPCLSASSRSSRDGKKDSQRPSIKLGGGERRRSALFTTIHDFGVRSSGELSFQTGDQFEILNGDADSDRSWRFARKRSCHDGGKCRGYIPSNYIASNESVVTEP
ncbi:tyrosine-protein kinase FRK-like [Leucoraja erinacea]|uniref:tyrosine-protein kinase FRK-like n=1 Tax=Leucoraja erinaceus TaxID=7782 RepID=UPI002455B4DC|nr:tyrosine-protein kinase FRK-like [Leucoraja erinacea]